jgi:hypothetical protein
MAEFNFFPADTKSPLMKYTQPKPLTHKPGKQKDTGYPQTGAKKNSAVMRGFGAATKGKNFNNGVD